MDKEKATKDINFRVQPSLCKKFQQQCAKKYKKVSEVLRDLMLKYIEENKDA